jgi:hypothetical protein
MPLEDLLRSLSVDNAWEHLSRITRDIPSRLAGSENGRRMAEYAHDAFLKAGLESDRHPFRGLVSFPGPGAVRVRSPGAREIVANTLGHSTATAGLEGELVYVGSGAESEYTGKDVRGKITLSELSYSPARHEKAYMAWKRGSSAQIMMNWGDDTNEAVPYGSIKSAWGNPTPETLETEMPALPCVGISRVEGLRLKALCQQGPVRVWLSTTVENGWKPVEMTTAEFGASDGREFLLLGGHMDSWFGPQATDNAAGSAGMLELSRAFNQFRGELRRGLVTGFWMGHETGTMLSSTRFSDVNWDRLRRSCVAYVQMDQPGLLGSSVWLLRSTDDAQAYMLRVARETVGSMPIQWARLPKTGDASFFGIGLPVIDAQMTYTDEELKRTALAKHGWWHHSIENTLDKVDRDLLDLHLRLYARWIWHLLTDAVLPYEYAPVGNRFAARLGELAALDIPDIDMASAVERAREFQQLATQIDQQSVAWRARGASADAEAAATILNRAMIHLSRTLVPVASTVAGAYGHDRYGHPWQTTMIPALAPYPSVARYSPESEEFNTWWVAMVRARNRVVDALETAADVARAALAQLH